MKRHYLTLVDFEDFIRPAFKLCCKIMNLNASNYRVEYEFSDTKRFGLFTFPNKITFYTNTLAYLGEDIDDNKTFIVHTIFHELTHSLQDISVTDTDSLELAADMEAIKYIDSNRNIIEKELRFYVSDHVLMLFNKVRDYEFIRATRKYTYINLLKAITMNRCNSSIHKYLKTDSGFSIIIINEKTGTMYNHCIKCAGEFTEPEPLVKEVSETLYQYSDIKYNVSFVDGGMIYTISDYTIKPIKK